MRTALLRSPSAAGGSRPADQISASWLRSARDIPIQLWYGISRCDGQTVQGLRRGITERIHPARDLRYLPQPPRRFWRTMRLSVAIPVHNEEQDLPELLGRLGATLDALGGGPHEMIFVDDGSRDGSL